LIVTTNLAAQKSPKNHSAISSSWSPKGLFLSWQMSLMSSNFCPHLIFKFGDLIDFSVLKD